MKQLKSTKIQKELIRKSLDESVSMILGIDESFTKKISSKKNTDLVPDLNYPDGVYILHETLGVKTVEEWNPKFNNGVIGILLIEDEHQIVVALENCPVICYWSEENKLVNRPIENIRDAKSDFNGEEYCKNLNFPEFPAAYYCLNYNKGGRKWYLPSSGELWMIYRHLEEVQTALSIVGGQKFFTTWDEEEEPLYWSSTEGSYMKAWYLNIGEGNLDSCGADKIYDSFVVRPVSNFRKNTLKESFTKKISSKKNTDLISEPAFVPDGVYILHETLGVKSVEEWNKKFNNGVVGILLIEDDHKIVIALEDSPENLTWSKEYDSINQPIENREEAESDFNGEVYCRNLNSPDFPAAYYCLNYNKGGRNWYLPSSGELWLIYRHLEEIQTALSIVGGKKFVTEWDDNTPYYWSSTENSATNAWHLHLPDGVLRYWLVKVPCNNRVRPVSNFRKKNTLKESFTKKISSKKNTDLISKPSFVLEDGVYILHETLGVKTVEEWNKKFNNGVIGILLIEDGQQIVVALEDSPENLHWSEERKLVNQSIKNLEEAESDFNGEEYCKNLNSPDFPAAYYCSNYKKGGRDWYLPSSGELWLIYRHLEEIQTILSIVGGQEFVTTWDEGVPVYWSSTEGSAAGAWFLHLYIGHLDWGSKVINSGKVRPISKFKPSILKESFTRKIRSKKNDELTKKVDTAFVPDGVYILHETLGVKGVEGWNPKNNDGVVGILFIEDDHKILIALEDSPENLTWSEKRGLINQPVDKLEDAESDFNGEMYCRRLDSPDFPATYYCKTYNKGNRDWYLPSSGELWLIYNHLEEIQNALSIVGGQKFVTTWDKDVPVYWSSTESSATNAWSLTLYGGTLYGWYAKVSNSGKVRPVSNFRKNPLKESFTKKISSKKNTDLISKPSFVLEDGVYIFHEILGLRSVEGWNPKDNKGVIGVLVVEDDYKIVVALEDSPENLHWSEERKLVNQSIENLEEAKSDFNGKEYCKNLNSPEFSAAYYCSNYKKGNRSWYLPSSGELMLIYRHLEEIQTALSIVEGQKFVTTWDDDVPCYWSSTEYSVTSAWGLYLSNGTLDVWDNKVSYSLKVRPVSNFRKNPLKESFTKKISSKKNTDLISKPSFVLDNGVYILHETLGVKSVEKWNKKFNNGVVGILLIEDDHKIVVALEESPKKLQWSERYKLVNQPIENLEEAESDFNGEVYCKNLNSPEFPAAYYCSNYEKGGRDWHLPSSGELWLVYRHLEEIQTALSIVGGQKFVTTWDEGVPVYWSSTEGSATGAWYLHLNSGTLDTWDGKVSHSLKVRPVSAFSV